MFTEFFYFLRARGLPVSLQEWLMLCEALEKGLAGASFSRFYDLCRAILVKSEADYDKFDRAFLEYFHTVAEASDRIPDVIQKWLDEPHATPNNYDEEIAQLNDLLTPEEMEKMLRERMEEQDSEHNGGSYWIGTGGMSVFGNAGNTPQGIRVGGQGRGRRAIRVAGERRFRDFTRDGREKFLDDVSELESCADDILSQIDSTLYKLKELKENKSYGMKNLNQFLSESLNEARNTPYRVTLNGSEDSEGYPISASITLDDPKDAKAADKWFEDQIGEAFEHVGGGPNNIEL